MYFTPQGPAKFPVLLNAGLVSLAYVNPENNPLGHELETPMPDPCAVAWDTTQPW